MTKNQIPRIIKSKIYKDKRGSLKEIFKSKDYNKAILPKEDELLIFPANLMHLPKISPGSKTSRRVIAGTISKVKYKSSKTLM